MGIIVKLLTVVLYAALLYFLIDFMEAKFAELLSVSGLDATTQYFICKFGVLEAVNIFVSLYVASWFTNKTLDYLR